ncbi:MAG: TetR/AcrR family transcriptional regulator [Pseudolabrys sp.]
MSRRPGAKPKRVTRRTQEERRRGTREAVLRAAMDVLIKHGYEKFTATRVAKAAGVSRGAQENYFRTKNELIVAATRYTLTRAVEEARALAARNARASDPIGAFLDNSKSFCFSPTYLALMEMVMVARRNRALAKVNTPVVRQFRVILDTIWIDALCAAGYERPAVEGFVKMTHYLLRGMVFASAWQSPKSEYPAMIEAWHDIGRRELKRV